MILFFIWIARHSLVVVYGRTAVHSYRNLQDTNVSKKTGCRTAVLRCSSLRDSDDSAVPRKREVRDVLSVSGPADCQTPPYHLLSSLEAVSEPLFLDNLLTGTD